MSFVSFALNLFSSAAQLFLCVSKILIFLIRVIRACKFLVLPFSFGVNPGICGNPLCAPSCPLWLRFSIWFFPSAFIRATLRHKGFCWLLQAEQFPQLHHLQRTLRPATSPADNQVAIPLRRACVSGNCGFRIQTQLRTSSHMSSPTRRIASQSGNSGCSLCTT